VELLSAARLRQNHGQDGLGLHHLKKPPDRNTANPTQTERNRAFIAEMLGQKKRLEDYPDRVDPNLVMHEPKSLPFGGTYRGLEDFKRFYAKVRNYYDFDTWQLIDVVAEHDIVFSTSQVRVVGRPVTMHIAERFRFVGPTLVEVRVFICEATLTAIPILIRRATKDDASQIGAVFDAAVLSGWTYLGELANKPMFTPAQWDDVVKNHAPPNELLIALDDSKRIAGFTAVHPAEGELYLLFVHPKYAGRGVGHALLDAAHEALRAAGCREVFLYTHEQNERAIRVYEAAGYRRDGTVRESEFRGLHLREPRLFKVL
jgi:ribosomal protein S18 acetylase RimI-like enzyme